MKTLGGMFLHKFVELVGSKFAKDPKSFKEDLKKFVEALENEDATIQGLRDQFCNLELVLGFMNNCHVWSLLLYGSWLMAFALIMTVILMVTGSGLLLAKPTKCMRKTALMLFAAAAVINFLGFAGYVGLTFNLQRWLVEIYGSHDGLTFSSATVACAGLTFMVCFLPVMVFFCTNQPGGKKDDDYDEQYYGQPMLDQYGNPAPVDQYGNPTSASQA